MADKFGSLSRLLDVRTVGYSSIVQVGFSILLVGNLWGWAAEQTEKNKTDNAGKYCTKANSIQSYCHAIVEMTYGALFLGHVHGVLNIRWDGHHVVL